MAVKSAYSTKELAEIFRRFSLQRPDPKSELHFSNSFTLLIAVVLSAQATDASVNKATKALFAVAENPQKMVDLGEQKIAEYIRTIGLWRNKAKNVEKLSQMLVEHYHGHVPDTREALMSLPGVGRKTANVVLNVAFHQPTLAVDTHIFRVANRLGLAPGKTPEEVEKNLLAVIPEPFLQNAHHWLILFGRHICKARKPECQHCIIADLCKAAVKTNSIPAALTPIN